MTEEMHIKGRTGRARLAILQALDDLGESAGAARILDLLRARGFDLQPRSIRFHLLNMDREGLTHCTAKHEGRRITDAGRQQLARISVMRKVGIVASRMDDLCYGMTLDIQSGKGSVVINAAMISRNDLSRALHYMAPVFTSGLSIGDRIMVGMAGSMIGGREVPRGEVMLATISSVTISGAFLKEGIPVLSRFGSLVEMEQGVPRRFIEITDYQGTSVDPNKVFIMAGMTSVTRCADKRSGIVCASFREFPSVAIDKARKLSIALNKLHLNAILQLGHPNRPLLDIPVGEGRTGMITIDGLNPFAVLHEAGIPVEISALAGLEELSSFVPFGEVAPLGRHSSYVE
ncbi:MAG: NrpR regulatory domain-containing protein [Chitinispirillaceae bacterium]|jgi:hypothetical protein|nr:NrpR regulatory domain-containing protein [Chitinispirillaceae bacterium]